MELKLEFVNASGKEMLLREYRRLPVGQIHIDISGIPPGIYFLRLQTDGKQLAVRKMLIER